MESLEKYNIDVYEDRVIISGYLSVREAFDFLNFYEREGYTRIVNSGPTSEGCLVMKKPEKPFFFDCDVKGVDNEILKEQIRFYEFKLLEYIETNHTLRSNNSRLNNIVYELNKTLDEIRNERDSGKSTLDTQPTAPL